MNLRDLVRDILWAKAHVLIVAGWATRPAWRYVRALEDEIPIPDDLRARARGHYKEDDLEPLKPRLVADMDGDEHDNQGGCGCRSRCRWCRGILHEQGAYGCLLTLCEECPADSSCWHPPGASID